MTILESGISSESYTSTLDRVSVQLKGRTGYLIIEVFPDGRIGNVINLIAQLQDQRANPKTFSEELGAARPISLNQFMDSYGDLLVEDGCPPFVEAIEAYRIRHGQEQLTEVAKRLDELGF